MTRPGTFRRQADEAPDLASLFKALGDEQRIKILAEVIDAGRTPEEIAAATGLDLRGVRLTMPRGYGIAKGDDLVPWPHIRERLEAAENYWVATTRPDGRPYTTPVWGAFVDGALWFDGIPTSRWMRNLRANPAISVHLESGTDVVIVEGFIEDLVTDEATGRRVVEAWNAKYGRLAPHPATDGIIRVQPRSIRAWTRFPDDATVWTFPDGL